MSHITQWAKSAAVITTLLLGVHTLTQHNAQAAAVRDVVISEVAWAGTVADINDEWIELHNNTNAPVNINGWTLAAADGTPTITFPALTIPANGYFLLERSDDGALPGITADFIYTGALGNTGEVLTLKDAAAVVVDTANAGSVAWLAGDATTKATMQRIALTNADSPSNWQNGTVGSVLDAAGNPVLGSPQNSGLPTPTPAPNHTPTLPVTATPVVTGTPAPSTGWIINEINADPDTTTGDSNRDGVVSSDDDEFIELINNTGAAVNISGWGVYDASLSSRFTFPAGVIVPSGCAVVIFGGGTPSGTFGNSLVFTASSLGLGNSGDQVALRDTNSQTLASVIYGIEAGNNQSLTRHPDLTGSYTQHSLANAALQYSPGTRTDGQSAFGSNCAALLTPTTVPTASRTPLPTLPITAAPSNTAAASITPGATPTNGAPPLPAAFGAVVINEIAWAGTVADANDEWLELYNTTNAPINLTGWVLAAADGSPNITLIGTIPANGYFLLERTDDTTVANITADQVYSGILTNTTENLTLKDTTNTLISTANASAAAWFAGNNTNKASMSRLVASSGDVVSNWCDSLAGSATDALGNIILGSPKAANQCSVLPATATLAPATATLAPATATLAPATATLAPATATLAPATATLAPATATLAPATATLAPATATLAPATATLAPATVTPVPATATLAPATATPVPTTVYKIYLPIVQR